MLAYFALFFVFVSAFLLYRKTGKALPAWLLSSLLMPAFVIFAEFALAYHGGGASLWPIALVVGSGAGILSSSVGVLFAYFLKNLD